MNESKKPYLTLVGAGPGDAELITLKGVKALQSADVVLYDALINTDLLDYAPKDAKLIFVGKRAGHHYLKQDEINDLIVKSAYQYGHVVRLKGGDSFVFGRGSEEIEHVTAFGIESSVVPGISSSIAVAETQKIPVTARGYAESFWVITGTTKNGQLSKDIRLAAQSSATVIVLMGMKKLDKIVGLFKSERNGDTPVAIIQNGCTPQEKVAIGTTSTIVDIVKEQKLANPAVVIIGEVVNIHPTMIEQVIEQQINKAL